LHNDLPHPGRTPPDRCSKCNGTWCYKQTREVTKTICTCHLPTHMSDLFQAYTDLSSQISHMMHFPVSMEWISFNIKSDKHNHRTSQTQVEVGVFEEDAFPTIHKHRKLIPSTSLLVPSSLQTASVWIFEHASYIFWHRFIYHTYASYTFLLFCP
jgi:hypothetical protein